MMRDDKLIQQRSLSGRALAAFDARTAEAAPAAPEERAWLALQARLAAPPPSARWLIWPAAALVASAAAMVIAVRPAPRPAPPAAARIAPSPVAVAPPTPAAAPGPVAVAPTPTTAAPPAIALSTRLRPLASGRLRLVGGIGLSVGRQTRARGSQQKEGHTRLVLASGTLELAVAPGEPERVVVRAGPYRFVDLGTVFRVTRQGARVTLWVDEGMVAVWRGRQRVATVNAGGHWSSPSAAAPLATGSVVTADPIQSCASLAAGSAVDAVACYGRLAGGGGLVAQTALYEHARLLAWQVGDLPEAMSALQEHRRRFPDGALRAEVDLTLVELLPRLGRFREALDKSAALLSQHPRHERAAELHLLRGNILRESFEDHARAGVEYAAVRDLFRPGQSSEIADDAAFFEAVCLEAGRRAEAADAYRRYLAGPAPRHAAQARARLSALAP
jgi:TolA-binding protein